MDKITQIIVEAAKKPAKKKTDKPLDPNEEARKKRGLRHKVGHMVHAGLAVKGGAGYRGEVEKIDDNHTYIRIDKKRVVKAPHHLVSMHEETKEEKKERLKKEAKREGRSFRDYSEIENKIEDRDQKSKRRHEHERKMHREQHDMKKEIENNVSEENAWDPNTKKDREVEHYHIVSKSTGKVVGKAKTMKSARTSRDKHDNNYGSYNHSIQPVFKEQNEGTKMKLTDATPDLVKAVRDILEASKEAKKDEKKIVPKTAPKATPMGNKSGFAPKNEEVEIIDERNKENKFKKDLHIAKKGVDHATKNLGFSPKDHADMSRAFGHDKPTERDNMKALLKDYKRRGRAVTKEEAETIEEGKMKNDGSTYGVSTPLKTKGKYASDDGRHVVKVRKDADWGEYRVELHSDGKHQKKADYHTDDKEEAHQNAKAMLAHAVKHSKPIKEETSLISKILNKYSK